MPVAPPECAIRQTDPPITDDNRQKNTPHSSLGRQREMPAGHRAHRIMGALPDNHNCIQRVKQSGDPHDFFMIGNYWVSDPMFFNGKDDTQVQIMLPAGLGFPIPATGASADAYLDFHGSCSGGRIVNVCHRVRAAVGLSAGIGARVSVYDRLLLGSVP
jgi:hypothetical protein